MGSGDQLDHGFDPRPWEEIAKLYEHQRRDFIAARGMVEEALARARLTARRTACSARSSTGSSA